MRRLEHYLISTIAASTLMVLMVVLSLDFVFGFIGELDELKNAYQMPQALLYVATTVPRRIYDYLPLAAFIGSLVGLGALANNSELVIIRAAGVSVRRIVWISMKPAIAVVIVGLLLGEFVAPYTEKIAQSQRAIAQGADQNITSHGGLWHREGNTFMHFNAVQPNGVLHGVSLFNYEDDKLKNSMFAKRAIYQRQEWQLEDVQVSAFAGNRVEVSHQHVVEWKTDISPDVLSVLVVKPDNLSISGLFTYSMYLIDQGLNAKPYMMAFWKKVLRPVATGSLVLVAISFIFGPLRSVTMGFRVFSGIIVGLLFKYMQDLLGPSSLVFGFDPILATVVPISICAVAGVVLLRRAK